MRLLCVSLERDLIKLTARCRWLCDAQLLQSLNEPNRASHMREDQEAFIVIKHLVVMGKALLIPDAIEGLHNGNA